MDNLAFVCEKRLEFGQNSNYYEKPSHFHTYEEAVKLTGHGKFHHLLLLTTGFCILAVMVEVIGVSVVIPAAKCDLQFTPSEQGILASAGFLGIVLSSHGLGFLADTWGRLRVLRVTLICSLTSSIISAFSTSVWMLSVFRFLVGFFIAGSQACSFSYLGEFHADRTRSRSIALLSTFLSLGMMVLPAIAIVVLPLKLDFYIFSFYFSSWRLLIILNSTASLMGLICLMFFPESPKYLLVQGHENEALEVLRKVYATNSGRPPCEYPVQRIFTLELAGASLSKVKSLREGLLLVWNQTAPLFYRNRVWHTLNILYHMFMAFFIAHGIFMWFPSILTGMADRINDRITVCEVVELLFLENKTAANVTESCTATDADILMFESLIAMGASYFIMNVVIGMIINVIGKKRLLIIWMTITGVCGVLLYWTNIFYVNVVLMTMFMAISNGTSIVSAIAMEFFPTNMNAMGMCLALMTGRLGAAFGSNIIGVILTYNCDALFWALGGVIFASSILSYFLPITGLDIK